MKKIKKLWQNKFFRNYFLLFITLFLLELEFRLLSGLEIFSYASLRIFLGLNIIAIPLSFLISHLPNLASKIITGLLIFLASIYGIAELGFKSFLGVYASVSTSSQAGAVLAYVFDFIASFKWYYYLLLIPFIFLLIYDIFVDKRVILDMPKKKVTKKLVLSKALEIIFFILICASYFATMNLKFMQNKTQVLTSFELFKKPTNPSLVINDFGYISFAFLDVKEYFLPGPELETKINYNPEAIGASVSPKAHTNIDNELWKQLIADETNQNLNALNKYFISKEPTLENDYTGFFAGKNLIVIMVESGSNLMLNEELYPNLSKIYNEGWTWKNYYSPRNSCSTGNNETSGMISQYSIYNNCTANVYKNNVYPESIFNLFNNKGYSTNSFHDHFDAYYYRTTIHKNMGSQKFYKVQDMGIKYGHSYGDWASDAEMMKFYLKTLDKRDTTKPFMSWITTVTSHQPYSNSSIYNDKYYDLTPKEYSKDVRRYMSKLKTVDEAIGILLEGLETRNLLDDTVIVLYADHYPYAISLDNLSEAYGYEVDIDNNSDQVPFIIYNSKLQNKTYDNYMSYIDLTPTIANLFSLDYDSRLYMGKDIFSNDDNMVIFADGSWKNKIGFYDSSSNSINYYTKKVYTDEELLAINEEVSLKLKMSSLVIRNNYFNYFYKKLDSYETTSAS